MLTIPRNTLIDIVRTAAREAGLLDRSRLRLWNAMRTTDRVAFGDFMVDGVGCPATQAGLRPGGSFPDSRGLSFATRFDCLVDDRLGVTRGMDNGVIEVTRTRR